MLPPGIESLSSGHQGSSPEAISTASFRVFAETNPDLFAEHLCRQIPLYAGGTGPSVNSVALCIPV
jgi:hypothetical protein